jgi:sugar diacid utilization regulator
MTSAVIAEVPAYQDMTSAAQRAIIDEHSQEHARAVIDCIRTWNLPSPEALAFVKERAALRAYQQLPLSALLHAYRVGHRTVWERLVRILADFPSPMDATLALTTMTLTYTELISGALAEGYVEHQRATLMHVDRARRDLLETLLNGDAESHASMRELAPGFALVAGADYLVVVLTSHSREMDSSASDTLQRHLALAIPQPFVVVRHREVVAVVPVARARPSSVAHLVRQAHAELNRGGDQWVGGISTLCSGLGEVARGYQEARHSLPSSGVRALLELRVHDYVLEHADGTALRMIPQSARRVLTSEPVLVETLQAYAQAEMSVRDAASILFVHPNTVVYRLEKLSRLLGRGVQRFSDLVEVLTWLRLLEL